MSKIAFLFPGQGAQSVGMGREVVEQSRMAAELFARAADVLDYDLARICFEGPAEKLDSTAISQPALYVTSLAVLEQLREVNAERVATCQAAAGLSLGEYTALTFAGALSFEDGLRLVQQRGEAMQAASDLQPSGMVSILGLDAAPLEEVCQQASVGDDFVQIANLLCPGNIAISGTKTACARASALALEAGAMKAVPLAVAGAFHTRIMQSAVAKLSEALDDVVLSRPRIPVISNVDARPHKDPDEIRQLLIQQIVLPVRWEDSIRFLLDESCDTFYEVGPGRVLRGLLKRINRRVDCLGAVEACA